MRAISIRAIAAALAWVSILGASAAGAQTPKADPTPAACFVTVGVDPIAGHPDEAALTLWADEGAGMMSGSVVAYAQNKRYRIPFTDAVAADRLNLKVPPTAIHVRFPQATIVESAYIETMEGASCVVYNPYVAPAAHATPVPKGPADTVLPDWTAQRAKLADQAAALPAIVAGAGETVAAPACAKADAPVALAKVGEVVPRADYTYMGPVVMGLIVRPDGTLYGARTDYSSRSKAQDAAVMRAATTSKYAPEIYRCQPVMALYRFTVQFASTTSAQTFIPANGFP